MLCSGCRFLSRYEKYRPAGPAPTTRMFMACLRLSRRLEIDLQDPVVDTVAVDEVDALGPDLDTVVSRDEMVRVRAHVRLHGIAPELGHMKARSHDRCAVGSRF